MKRLTLTWKLFIRVAPIIIIVLTFIGFLAFHSATREINNIYDAELINDANVLWNLLQKPLNKQDFASPRRFKDLDFAMANQLSINEDVDDYADAHMFRVWKDGHIAIYSSNAFDFTHPISSAGLTNVSYAGEDWRVYTLHVPNTAIVIESGEKVELRNTLVSNILLNLLLPLIILIPIIGFLIWIGIRSGLRTVYGLVDQIKTRSPDDLSLIHAEGLPRDLKPLNRSINQLLSKLDLSLTAERRFADNAAHQLRTPNAGSKLLLQMLQKTNDEEEQRNIISNLVKSNERAQHLIEQLLRAGRVSHQSLELKVVRLYDVTASILALLGPRIRQKKLDVALEGQEEATIKTDEGLLSLMIENLIENAVKYTPEYGSILVTLNKSDAQHWRLSIADSGPGIPAELRKSVFDRFYRVGTNQVEGAGLGLSIVADIAARLSIMVSLNTPQSNQGLQVDLIFEKASHAE